MDDTMKTSQADGKNDGAAERAGSQPWTSAGSDEARMRTDGGGSASSQLAVQTHNLTSQVARSAQGLVAAEVGKQTDKGATDLRDVAKALRKTSQELENNMAAPYVEKAADQIDRASTFLRTADATDVMRTVERFAKREPLLFLGGAFALGLLGARFMKSSSHGHGGRGFATADGNGYVTTRSSQNVSTGVPRS
jgi:hypothetical protein